MRKKHPRYIDSEHIRLRPATVSDKRLIYHALACSELTEILLGRPGSMQTSALTWEQFCDDHKDHYFEDSDSMSGRAFVIEAAGRHVGQVYYNKIFGNPPRTEIDIWMFSEANCGHGHGSEALRCLCDYLAADWGIREFFIMPSCVNKRAIRAYEKAGFEQSRLSSEKNQAKYRERDDSDTVYMTKTIETIA